MRKFLLSLILVFSLFFSFWNFQVNAGGFSSKTYWINTILKQKINNVVNNISVKIIKNWWKESKLYEKLISKINNLIKEKTDKWNIEIVNILKYIKNYLNLSLDIEPIVKNNIKYDEIFKEFIANKMNSINWNYEKREKLDKEVIEKNKKLFLELFKQNKLPILHKIKVWKNEIFVTSAYSNFKNNSTITKDCWYYFSPGWFANYNICIEIIKNWEKYDLKSWNLVFTDWNIKIETEANWC